MAKYTQLSRKNIQEIVKEFGLVVSSFEPYAGGAGNSSFWLKTRQGEFMLTVFDDKSEEYVNRMARLLLYLEKNKFSYPLYPKRSIPSIFGFKYFL